MVPIFPHKPPGRRAIDRADIHARIANEQAFYERHGGLTITDLFDRVSSLLRETLVPWFRSLLPKGSEGIGAHHSARQEGRSITGRLRHDRSVGGAEVSVGRGAAT